MWKFNAGKTDRIDRLIREADFPGKKWLSRAALDELIEQGRVAASGKRVGRSGIVVTAESEISLDLPELGLLRGSEPIAPVWLDPEKRLGIFNKPAGISTYPLVPWATDTLANRIVSYINETDWITAEAFTELADPPILEGGLLQRLDRDTSGIVLVAFQAATKKAFREALRNSALEKRYQAIVAGNWRAALGRHQFSLRPISGGKKMEAVKGEDSGIEIVLRSESGSHAQLEVRTRQGARHIVRACLAALGIPLVGDRLYGGEESADFHQLHASQITVGQEVFPEFPSGLVLTPPQSFLDCLTKLGLH
jgi:23S rRNA pseudouridine1911/1915/1917 synthase